MVMFELHVPVGSFICCEAKMLLCPHPGCTYFSRSQHGINVHVSREHCVDRQFCAPRPSISKRRVTVPRKLQGNGKRLLLDRVVEFVNQDPTLPPDDVIESVPEELRMLDMDVDPAMALPTEESALNAACDHLADAFINITRAAPDRLCNALLVTMRKYSSYIEHFVTTFSSIDLMRSYKTTRMEGKLMRGGFEKRVMTASNGLKYELYCRNPVDVLVDQVAKTPSDGVVTVHGERDVYCHPLNSFIGKYACPAAERAIKQDCDSSVSWKTYAEDGVQSAIGCLQIFSDKSQTSLKAGSLVFYPLHVTLLNFTEEWRRAHITSGRTITSYLPVTFSAEGDSHTVQLRVGCKWKSFPRIQVLRALHESVERSLDPLAYVARKGIAAKSTDRRAYVFHILLCSYLSDIPEAEDMLGVKRGVLTKAPCHNCLVRREDMADSTFARRRTLRETLELLENIRIARGTESPGAVVEQLDERSMLSIRPVLSNFPLVGIHSCVDLYTIFRFEPMHGLSLGVSKLLKECAIALLGDSSRASSSMVTGKGAMRGFPFIRKQVLFIMNTFLRETEMTSPGYGLQVDFSKGELGGRLSGFFYREGGSGYVRG